MISNSNNDINRISASENNEASSYVDTTTREKIYNNKMSIVVEALICTLKRMFLTEKNNYYI
jgi:hypothetical protein